MPFPAKLCHDAKAAGFSLLEVLVAAAIVSLTLVVFLQGLAGSLQQQETLVRHLEACWLAERLLAGYQQADSLAAGAHQGREGRFHYEVKVLPQYQLELGAERERLICYLIRVTVSWRDRGRTKTWTTQTARTVKAGS